MVMIAPHLDLFSRASMYQRRRRNKHNRRMRARQKRGTEVGQTVLADVEEKCVIGEISRTFLILAILKLLLFSSV